MEVNTYSQGGQPSIDISQREITPLETVDNTKPNMIAIKDTIEISSTNKENMEPKVSDQQIKKAVDKLNVFLEDNKSHAVYSNHAIFKNVTMVKIIDDKTGDIVQEIPPQKILDMVAKMCEIVGLFLDKKA